MCTLDNQPTRTSAYTNHADFPRLFFSIHPPLGKPASPHIIYTRSSAVFRHASHLNVPWQQVHTYSCKLSSLSLNERNICPTSPQRPASNRCMDKNHHRLLLLLLASKFINSLLLIYSAESRLEGKERRERAIWMMGNPIRAGEPARLPKVWM